MDFIFKGFPKVLYSDQADLNLVPSDFGDEMIAINYEGDVTKRLKTATGSIASPELFAEFTATLNIKKTSPQYLAYKNRVNSNTVIPGSAIVVDDANQQYNITRLSIKPMAFNASGNDVVVQFVLQGNMQVNGDLIASVA